MMNKTISILRAPALQASCRRGAIVKRAAQVLLMTLLLTMTAQTAGATETSTITVGGTDYTLFTGFTATGGNGTNYAKLVDGNTSTDWIAAKSYGVVTNDFNGGTDDPAFVEFHADEPIVPKGYVLTCDHENAGFWKPVEWALKAKLNEGDEWTTIHSSNTTLGAGKTFEIACDNDDNNEYQYFRFEVYEVGTTKKVDLDELQFYGLLPTYTHLTVKAATCMATGIKQDCYRRNSDGKYFTDNTGTTELQESDVIAPMIPHSGEHHEATDVNIEYWQCSMCHKYFSDEGCTTEITEEQTKIYRTITIDGSISSLVTSNVDKAVAGTTIELLISDLIDAPTLKVNNGAVELTAVTDIQYAFTMPAADVTVTAEVAQSNGDGDNLTGSIRHTVTIPHGASITLNDAAISGSIVCEGSATITLVGTNSVSGATNKAGIQIGGSGTTLTIRGDGSLTANGGAQSAGIGLSRIWNYDSNVTSGDIIIEGGTITATGGHWGAGIGTGVIKNTNNDNSTSVQFGNVTIKGGTVTATGGDSGDGIGKGYSYPGPAITFGTVTIYDGIDKVDASSIKNFGSVVYMHSETNVTASKADYFTIIENGNRRIIVQKVTPTIADVPDQTYTGSEITPEPLVLAGSLNLTKGTDYEYSYTNNTNFGTAKVTVTFMGNYASLGSVEKEFNIVRATPTVTAPTANTLTYNGNEQKLITAGSTNFGTLLYSTDGENYSADIPTATDGGNYTVYYKVEESDNWNAVAAQTVEMTIASKPVTVTADNKTKEYGADDPMLTATVEGLIGEDAISYTVSRAEGETVGEYAITPTGEALQGNYSVTFVPGYLTITMPTQVSITLAKEYGTYCSAYDLDFSGATGLEAYIAAGYNTSEGSLLMVKVTSVPAGTGLLLKSTSATGGDFTAKVKASTYVYSNLLTGTTAQTTVSGSDFILGKNGDKVGFYRAETGTLAAGKAYLKGLAAPSSARIINLVFDDDATAIENYRQEASTTNDWYTLDGRKLEGKPTRKGLYIKNGKKVVVR